MRMTKLSCAVLVLFGATLLGASQVRADGTTDFVYTVSGLLNGTAFNNTFTWDLPTTPSPSSVSPGDHFELDGVSVTENGTPLTGSFQFFLGGPSGGGLQLTTTGVIIDALGPQLFGGTESSPSFLSGTFTLTDFLGGDPTDPSTPTFSGTLVMTSTSVPEPSSLLLLLVGLTAGVVLFSLRKN